MTEATQSPMSAEAVSANIKLQQLIEQPVMDFAKRYRVNMAKAVIFGGVTGMTVGLINGFSKPEGFGPMEYVELGACTTSGLVTGYITGEAGIESTFAIPMSFLSATSSLKIADILNGYVTRFSPAGKEVDQEEADLLGQIETLEIEV